MRRAYWLLQIATLLSMGAFQLNAHSLSGNAGIASAAMNLTGGENLTVTADFAGNYFFRRLRAGNYTVTPSLNGYSFSPASQSVTIDNASVNSVSFTAIAINTTMTDLVAAPASLALTAAGATQQLAVLASYSNGASTNVTASATYASNSTSVATVSQSGLVTAMGTGNATVIASYGGLSASVSIAVSISSATYSLSGSAGAASATVALSGAAGPAGTSATASNSGTFSFSSLPSGSYIITPSLAGYTFAPSSQSVTITNANVSGVNFAATATPHSVDLSWGAATIENPVSGQVVVGYNIYRSSVSGGPYTQLNAAPTPGLTYVDNTVSAGETLFYVCSTVDNLGNVSGYSNQTAATVP
jgi:Bacterial Ig-like domain (group 2)